MVRVMDMLGRGHGDETTTGTDAELRGLRRVTIAARMDDDDYEWLARFYAEHFADDIGVEPKSHRVLGIIAADPRARYQLLTDVSRATVIIIDIAEFVRDAIRGIAEAVDLNLREFADPIDVLARRERSPVLQRLAAAVLAEARERAIDGTMLGRIEGYVLETARTFLPIQGQRMLDRRALREMGEGEFRVVAARFAVTLGDALRPENLDRIVEERLRQSRFLPAPHYIAVQSIDVQLGRAHVFDEGAHRALTELDASRRRLEALLNETPLREFRRPAGAVTEEDSRRVLGLQAADIAAGVAREIFEGTDGGTRERARAVRGVFDRVLFNDTWL